MNSFFHNGNEVLMLIDAHAIIYRAYFALPQNLTTPDGKLVNAAFGFTRILLTAIRDMKPTHLSVVFDHPEPTFRRKEFADYKAHREEMPADLIPQVDLTKKIVSTLNIPQFELAGFEADDLIGTLSQQTPQKTVIVTGDQDLFQLVNDRIHVWLPPRGKRPAAEYDRQQVYDKLGVYPKQVVDMKALMGDSSDNIPGIRGIGPKTAVGLLQKFGTLEKIYQAVDAWQEAGGNKEDNLLKGAVLKKLRAGRQDALLSQKLARIELEAPIKLDLDSCQVTGYDKAKVVKLFQALEFRSLINLLPNDEFETSIQESLF